MAENGLASKFAIRVVTAVLLGIVILAGVIFGGTTGLALVLSVVCGFAVAEFYGLSRQEHRKPNEVFGVAAALSMPLATAFFPDGGLVAVVTLLIVASLAWHLAFRQVTAADTAMTVFGVVYVGFTLSHLVLLRALPEGVILVVLTFAGVWVNDVFAYLIGTGVGRHKLAPSISPHKSWEGFAGGAVCCVLVWVAAFSVVPTGLTLPWHAAIGVAVPLAALVGDLVESRFKRQAGAKDSGRSLPGHGGFLDRFDSLMVVSVVVYYLVVAARYFR